MMTNCSICNSELKANDTRKCEYCGAPLCNKCVDSGKLLINDEIGLWMCPTCVKKSLDWEDH
ncbi:MAG: hypothetical protein GF353_29960 [Candidatus Lokiarchaeota archaeon]|nr:hypothetical protein [Candidatus Lokiarchaeota archaeon]